MGSRTQRQFHIRSQKGFGLAGALAAVAILSIVIAGVMSMFNNIQAQLSLSQAKVGQLGLAMDLRTQISKSAVCTPALQSTQYSTPPTGMPVAISLGGSRVVTSGADLRATDGILIDQLTFTSPQTIGTDAAGNSIIYGDLVLAASYARGSQRISYGKLVVGKVFLTVKPDKTIAGCYSGEDPVDLAKQACELSKGTFANGSCQQSRTPAASDCGPPPVNMTDANSMMQITDDVYRSRKNAFCRQQTYPMTSKKKWPTPGFPADGYCATYGCMAGPMWAYAESIAYQGVFPNGYGPYQSLDECLNEPLHPGGSAISNPSEKYVCVEGKWIPLPVGGTGATTTYQEGGG